jgi:spore maturation protein SpmA
VTLILIDQQFLKLSEKQILLDRKLGIVVKSVLQKAVTLLPEQEPVIGVKLLTLLFILIGIGKKGEPVGCTMSAMAVFARKMNDLLKS